MSVSSVLATFSVLVIPVSKEEMTLLLNRSTNSLELSPQKVEPNSSLLDCGPDIELLLKNRMWEKRWCVAFKMKSLKALQLPPCLFLDHFLWGKPAVMSWGHSRNPYGSVHVVRN